MNEYDSGFFIELQPESVKESAMIVRLGLNSTKNLDVSCFALKDSIGAQITIGIRKNETNQIGK